MPSMNKRSRRTKPKSTKRKSNHDTSEYHSMDWRNYSRKYRSDNPECVMCGGKTRCIDHIIPIRIGGSFWDVRNHQAMCNGCHGKKSSDESRDIYMNSKNNIDGDLIPSRGDSWKSESRESV